MNVIIVGCGKVGYTLAETLSNEVMTSLLSTTTLKNWRVLPTALMYSVYRETVQATAC